MRAIILCACLLGCSHLSGVAAALQTADTVGRGVARVLNWCEENGARPEDIVNAAEKVKEGDNSEALRLAFLMVKGLRARGVEMPEDQAAILQLAEELQAAQAIEQAARALAGRNAEGAPK